MARARKMTVGRFLKRNMLYIILTSVLVLLLTALTLVLILLFRDPSEPEQPQEPSQSVQETTPPEMVEKEPEPEQPQAQPPQQTQQPEEGKLPAVFQPPFAGKTKFLANQKLALTYDDTLLSLKESGDVYSLTPISGEKLPRMDLQRLNGALEDLDEADRQWLAAAMVQKYYYMAPPAEEISLRETASTETAWSVTMDVPAYMDAAAACVKLQLLQVRDQFWYVILLLPEDSDGAALEQAYDNLVIR